MSPTIVLIITLVAVFLLYRFVERRFNEIERRLSIPRTDPDASHEDGSLSQLSEKIKEIKELCSPLVLLNIFDENDSLTVGDDMYLNWLVSDFAKAEDRRISEIKELNNAEKEELENYAKEHPNEKDFVPSKDLRSHILSASAAIVIRQIIYAQLQSAKEIYFDVINGKLSINEARKKAKEVANRKDYNDMYLQITAYSSSNPDTIDEDTDNLELKKQYRKTYDMREKSWKDMKWKERLNWYKEEDEKNEY